jgi:hypothetical protein
MEPDDLLCSRNAWEEKGSLVVLLLAERARSECARSTRAIEDRPAHPLREKRASLEGARYRWTRARWEPARRPSDTEGRDKMSVC